jgi:hypothetical protein
MQLKTVLLFSLVCTTQIEHASARQGFTDIIISQSYDLRDEVIETQLFCNELLHLDPTQEDSEKLLHLSQKTTLAAAAVQDWQVALENGFGKRYKILCRLYYNSAPIGSKTTFQTKQDHIDFLHSKINRNIECALKIITDIRTILRTHLKTFDFGLTEQEVTDINKKDGQLFCALRQLLLVSRQASSLADAIEDAGLSEAAATAQEAKKRERKQQEREFIAKCCDYLEKQNPF